MQDKYYHMKAYCKVAQRESEIANMIALGIGNIREVGQSLISLASKEASFYEAVKDFREDIRANQTGTVIGKNYPSADIDSVLQMLWPDILDQVYRD